LFVIFLVFGHLSLVVRAQSTNSTILGTVTDPSGAVVPKAQVELRSMSTAWTMAVTAGTDGSFRFPNVQDGAYELHVSFKGFSDFVQRGIAVNINESVNVPVKLQVGAATQTVEVSATASPLNVENGEMKGVVAPNQLSELPLIASGNQRAASSFVLLMPGVSAGTSANPYNARVNGGLTSGMEATLDGVTVVEGLMSQSGMVAMFSDYPITPESLDEISVLTSNYQPQYGYTTSGVLTLVTKSGTNQFHGSGFEYLRNTALNARQFGAPSRSPDLENEFGGNIGGPVKIPKLWSARNKLYFFANLDWYYLRGAIETPVLSIPSMKERVGDFSDWVDTNGNLIPVYDPATTQVNPNYNPNLPPSASNGPFTRQQFMGCNGSTPNVICPSDPRLQNSVASGFLKYLPAPTFPGALNNFVPSKGGGGLDHKDAFDFRFDEYLGEKDHIAVNIHYHIPRYLIQSYLPLPISNNNYGTGGGGTGPWSHRVNWDHTITPSLINNFNIGYMDMSGGAVGESDAYVKELPHIPGLQSYSQSPLIQFQNFFPYGYGNDSRGGRPTTAANDLLTWVRGKHTLKFGTDIRNLELNSVSESDASGTFNFAAINTGLPQIPSGNDVASFLLGQVNNANAEFYTVAATYMRQFGLSFFAGDTWKVTPKLSLDYGLRWDRDTPSTEKYNHMAFFDSVGVNPDAGDIPGRLAFAGSSYGPASFGSRHPENTWDHGIGPRLGFGYSLTPKTVIRAGYGIFYNQAFYPGWGGGLNTSGFNANPSFTSSDGGITAAFLLNQGFPSNFNHPPFINSGFLNGEGAPTYRPFDANRLGNAQQWNLTVEHQFTSNFYINASYVGNKGTRLPSTYNPVNTINPKFLSMGQQLYDIFQPGDSSRDGIPIPYAGWVDQMTGCPPTVAQALLPYPQYCGTIGGVNENAGNSTYHALQLKVEKRYGHGLWVLGSYTLSKELTSSDETQQPANGEASYGVISPFQRRRNKGLANSDSPHVLSVSLIYQLPVGKGKRWLNQGGVVDKVLGGWETSNIFHYSAGIPFFFTSSSCNIPSQFGMGCIPAILPGANPWAQSKSHYDPSLPLFNVNAFEPASSFNFYAGQGPRMSNLRGFPYINHDFALVKTTSITEKVGLQIRAECFNVWNWHYFDSSNSGGLAVGTDIASPSFGIWNGSVSNPRNVQMAVKILF